MAAPGGPGAQIIAERLPQRDRDTGGAAVPQIKICGLTVPEQAAACARLGADAVGLVFFPPSPRHLELSCAAAVAAALPEHVLAAGVFVDPPWDQLARAVDRCGLGVVQLHGNESPAFVRRVRESLGVKVLKGLFVTKQPSLEMAPDFAADAFLVECGKGLLPGGNAMVWDWGSAAGFARSYPTVLAGGLDPDNVSRAVRAALPDAVDASSGLEVRPGHKDLEKVERFIAAVKGTAAHYREKGESPRPIF